MRLIDADALLKALRVNEDEWGTPDETWRPESEYGGAIKTAPTIEAEPVRRGKWEREDEYGDLWVCNQCGFAGEYKDNYCPNCGARMERSRR